MTVKGEGTTIVYCYCDQGTMGRLDPTSREPLLPLVLESIGEGDAGDRGGGGIDPSSFYLGGGGGNDGGNGTAADDDARLAAFWDEALVLSCLRRGALHSTAEKTRRDVAGPSSSPSAAGEGDGEERARRADFVRGVIGRGCASIASDGSVVAAADDESRRDGGEFASLRFRRGTSDGDAIPSASGLEGATDDAIEGAARLTAAAVLARGPSGARGGAAIAASSSAGKRSIPTTGPEGERDNDDATAVPSASRSGAGGWLSYLAGGVGRAIDRALDIYDGGDDGRRFDRGVSEPDDAKLSASDAGSISNGALYDGVDDAAAMRNGGAAAVATTAAVGVDDSLGCEDEVVCIRVVASACEMLLRYARHQHGEGTIRDAFVPGSGGPGAERTMLRVRGWDAHSFGSFCRRAGRHFAAGASNAKMTGLDEEKSMRLGEVLGGVSEREACLLASTLCRSNFALIENDETITLFPGGVPSGFESSQSDRALFQIGVAKDAIQRRMACLERTANASKASVVKAQRSKMTSLATVHLRRRRAALAETERCAGTLANLDSAELRLERAEGDAQLVQTYGMVREALKGARASREEGVEDGVEGLVSDLREEMEKVEMWNEEMGVMGEEAILPGGITGEEDLNEEFRRLELECRQEERSKEVVSDPEQTPETPVGAVGGMNSEAVTAQPMVDQEQEDTSVDVNVTKKAEAVAM